MKNLAIISLLLLFAGIGIAFGDTGNCSCPNSTACPQAGCVASCGGACAHNAGTESAAISAPAAAACGAQCPNGGCGSAGGCQACCGTNCAACCGSSAYNAAATATASDSGTPAASACAPKCPRTGCGAAGGCQPCPGNSCAA
ncbi:MAG TPA: hypothetical protein VN455_09995 [Methanotrichaceae archaeon]|nr:hypothetical protein [Methanotrichaceae archaeon]